VRCLGSCQLLLQSPYVGGSVVSGGSDEDAEKNVVACGKTSKLFEEYTEFDGFPLPAVQQLVPSGEVIIHWDGTVYTMDFEMCSCGCTGETEIWEGSGTAGVCGYRSYRCMEATCTIDGSGVIPMAEVSGDPVCVEGSFSFPADGGGTLVLTLR
jgi:hypothetical protein